MIFVTVGTTHFDELVRAVDKLASDGTVSEPVTCQIGSGAYIPKSCEYFRFRPSIGTFLHQASLVICHGGSTIFALMKSGKPFIAVPNKALADDHQTKMLSRLGEKGYLMWADEPEMLAGLLEQVRTFRPTPLPESSLVEDLCQEIDDST